MCFQELIGVLGVWQINSVFQIGLPHLVGSLLLETAVPSLSLNVFLQVHKTHLFKMARHCGRSKNTDINFPLALQNLNDLANTALGQLFFKTTADCNNSSCKTLVFPLSERVRGYKPSKPCSR